ncbi:MAG TPA: LLM class flavin-dependent oxidoreductase [Candidatus Binatia bacterium]|nr:LLM class flavin-dependent oxidoreductase [Candidatus Binatia bacterium]
MTAKPSVSLVAVAGRRRATLDLARRLEDEGFGGIYCPSPGDGLALCEALALGTKALPLGTSIANIYTRHAFDYAQTAAVVHELSGGRFRFGIGISHGPTYQRLNLKVGKPLEDIRKFVADVRAAEPQVGTLPPLVLATLRGRMVELAGEIAEGCVWANAARSHMATSLSHLPDKARSNPDFFVGDMIPTCISEDRAAAAAVNRKTLTSYVKLPNYQNYWIEAGYDTEMTAIRAAIARNDDDGVRAAMSDRWLSDVTLYGGVQEVRDGVEAWRAAGVGTVILVPSSTRGGQMQAFEELIAAFH